MTYEDLRAALSPVAESHFTAQPYGLECCVLFHPMGFRCGYVHVPEEMVKAIKKRTDEIVCHGGITYRRDISPLSDEKEQGIWLGFDCAHYTDDFDRVTAEKYGFKPFQASYSDKNATSKDLSFCEVECMRIAQQVCEIAESAKKRKRK